MLKRSHVTAAVAAVLGALLGHAAASGHPNPFRQASAA
jgi:hypothetical protein